jgi:hypothetical protein
MPHAEAVSATRGDSDLEIARLIAERDSLQIRLQKSIDVRNNLAAWNEDAEAQIAALTEKLAKVRRHLPDGKTLQKILGAAREDRVPGRKDRSALRPSPSNKLSADAAIALCRVIEGIRALVPDDTGGGTKRSKSGTRPVSRQPRRRSAR